MFINCRWAECSGGARNFHLGFWGTEVPSEVQGRSPGKGIWSSSSLQTLFSTDFNCRTDQNWKILHSSPRDSWPVCFTVGAKWHLGGLAPSPSPPLVEWQLLPRAYLCTINKGK